MIIRNNLQKLIRRLIRSWAVPVGCSLLFLFLLRFVFFVGFVPSSSMEPAIKQGSLILGIRLTADLKAGDVVVFEHDGYLQVKRISGAPGDRISLNNGALTVPAVCYFVLGDNTESSFDSRYWDEPFVPVCKIIAKLCISR
jgi:signal peptidase I